MLSQRERKLKIGLWITERAFAELCLALSLLSNLAADEQRQITPAIFIAIMVAPPPADEIF